MVLLGESGTGKSVLAREIHRRSARASSPFVTVSCPSLSHQLLESELFGHAKGAFTGATTETWGKVAAADGGTLFLDEIGDLPIEIQSRLLRLLQEREYERVGETKSRRANVRVIAATNRDLAAMVGERKFRSDLFYRLNVVPVTMPSLRERVNDIPLLTMFFLEKFARKVGRPITELTEETMARLCAYAWPGNIRELQNVIERAAALSLGPLLVIDKGALPGIDGVKGGWSPEAAMIDAAGGARQPINGSGSMEDIEREHVLAVLERTNWRVEGAQGAARVLDLQPSTLRSRMQKLGIVRPRA